MRTYRVYFLDEGAQIRTPPIDIECANDHDASQKARQLVDGYDTELWEEERFVGRFKSIPRK